VQIPSASRSSSELRREATIQPEQCNFENWIFMQIHFWAIKFQLGKSRFARVQHSLLGMKPFALALPFPPPWLAPHL
jgi:hypothetical protein